jgi:hypothetical protein
MTILEICEDCTRDMGFGGHGPWASESGLGIWLGGYKRAAADMESSNRNELNTYVSFLCPPVLLWIFFFFKV